MVPIPFMFGPVQHKSLVSEVDKLRRSAVATRAQQQASAVAVATAPGEATVGEIRQHRRPTGAEKGARRPLFARSVGTHPELRTDPTGLDELNKLYVPEEALDFSDKMRAITPLN